jgi:DUF4097 and DUF4098 domain-containing protein YvlB
MTAFFNFSDGNTLLSSQLNGNFGLAVNATLTTPQTMLGPLTVTALTTAGLVNTASEVMKVTSVTASGTYVATANDCVILVNKTVAGTSTVTLPSGPLQGRMIVVKDARGDATANPVTVSGAQTIDGLSSTSLSANYAGITLVFSGVQWCLV